MTSPLISVAEASSLLGDPHFRPVDGSWRLDGRDARPDFVAARVPGAVFFDLEASSDAASPLPHMLPAPSTFGERMSGLGLSNDDRIVVYDTVGLRSSPRVWWMLKIMGARDVRVLDGGLPAWRAEGAPIETGEPVRPSAGDFQPQFRSDAVLDRAGVAAALARGDQVLDARSAGRFAGTEPEPRAGLRSGHMPGALNLPFNSLIAPDGRLQPPQDLAAVFDAVGLDVDRPIVTTCGSGVTAAILSLGLETLGVPSRLYDGSWAEWGLSDGGPVETG